MILSLQQGFKDDGIEVSLVKLCEWVWGCSAHGLLPTHEGPAQAGGAVCQAHQGDDRREPVVWLSDGGAFLDLNKNTVLRVFQLMGWQVRKRRVGFRPRIQPLPLVAKAPDERWATDLCRIWAGKDGWSHLALVIDCHTRELLGWYLSRSGRSKTADAALEQALITRYGCLEDQCVHRHRFDSLQHASRVIGNWIGFHNHQRPHQALDMKTPAEAYALAA